MYWMSGNFRDDLNFAFFAISFKSQNTEYVEIISCIIMYKKLLKLLKMTDATKKCYILPHFIKFCDTWKNQLYSNYTILLFVTVHHKQCPIPGVGGEDPQPERTLYLQYLQERLPLAVWEGQAALLLPPVYRHR